MILKYYAIFSKNLGNKRIEGLMKMKKIKKFILKGLPVFLAVLFLL